MSPGRKNNKPPEGKQKTEEKKHMDSKGKKTDAQKIEENDLEQIGGGIPPYPKSNPIDDDVEIKIHEGTLGSAACPKCGSNNYRASLAGDRTVLTCKDCGKTWQM